MVLPRCGHVLALRLGGKNASKPADDRNDQNVAAGRKKTGHHLPPFIYVHKLILYIVLDSERDYQDKWMKTIYKIIAFCDRKSQNK